MSNPIHSPGRLLAPRCPHTRMPRWLPRRWRYWPLAAFALLGLPLLAVAGEPVDLDNAELAKRLLATSSAAASELVIPVGPDYPRARIQLQRFDLGAAQAERRAALAKSGITVIPDRRLHFVGRSLDRPDIRVGLSLNPDGSGLRGFVSRPQGLFLLTGDAAAKAPGSAPRLTLQRYAGRSAERLAADQRASLLADAKANGPIRVVLGLRWPFTPAGELDAAAVEDQQFAIAALQHWALSELGLGNHDTTIRYAHVPYLAVTLDAAALLRAAASAEIDLLQADTHNRPSIITSTAKVGATQAWSDGFTGSGQTIAVIDSGIRTDHFFFPSGKIVYEACFSNGNCPVGGNLTGANEATGAGAGTNCPQFNPDDNTAMCGHGTHVAGIAGGNLRTQLAHYRGVAFGASLMSFRVLNADGGLSGANVVRSLDAITDLAGSFSIAAVNISSGTNVVYSDQTTCDAVSQSHTDSVANLYSLGIAVVAASGNDFQKAGIDHPACMPQVISVGMTRKEDDVIPSRSNSAPFLDLLAPGSAAVEDPADHCQGAGICSAVPQAQGQLEWGIGTSQAAPHVSGAFAVMRQKVPAASIDSMLAALKSTGTLLDDPATVAVEQFPRINLAAALAQLTPPTQATLTVQKTDFGLVTSTPAGITCGDNPNQTTCSADFALGQQVTLTATATHGPFSHWSGDADCSDGVVTMSADRNCTAHFSQAMLSITVQKIGTGTGRVTSTPAGIDCGSSCSASFALFSSVTLNAVADVGSSFTGWQGDAACDDTPISLSSSLSCQAEFSLDAPAGPDPLVHRLDFEPPRYAGSEAGVDLNGQQDFINPVPESSQSVSVFSHTGQPLLLPTHASGGLQFAGGSGPAGGFFLRSQTRFGFASSDTAECSIDANCSAPDICRSGRCVFPRIWNLCFDLAVSNQGPRPAPATIASLSLLEGSDNVLILRADWVDRETTASWDARVLGYDAAGVARTATCASALSATQWWRWCTRIDVRNNRALSCELKPLGGAAVSRTSELSGHYVFGGAGALASPDALRLFIGGDSAVAGNGAGFDNLGLSAIVIFADSFD